MKMIYKVSGPRPFPLDMLRYDRSSPYAERDSQKIAESILSYRPEKLDAYIEADFCKQNVPRGAKLGIERWRSFLGTRS